MKLHTLARYSFTVFARELDNDIVVAGDFAFDNYSTAIWP